MTGRQPRNLCGSETKPINPMKATKLLLAAALFTGLTALSFAGPGPDYWLRIRQSEKQTVRAKADVQAKEQVAKVACTTCGCPAMKKS